MYYLATSTSRRAGCIDCRKDRTPIGASTLQTSTVQVSSSYSRCLTGVRRMRSEHTIGAVSERTEMTHHTKAEEVEKFDWFKTWWPVQAVENLPTDRPYRIQLLGKYYVVWKGHSGSWIAMDDECPHRLAPLSEGRVEKDGNLLCSYHAWRFNESGKCVRIPHVEDEKAHSVACNSPRSAVQTYPCKTRGALLWIWPDNSDSAFVDSEKALLPIEDDFADCIEQSAADGSSTMYIRYMPYSFDVLMENLCDPSHVPISHHGVMPALSRYNAKALHARLVEGIGEHPVTTAFRFKPVFPFIKWSQMEFRKPAAVAGYVSSKDGEVATTRLLFAATPISAERSLLINVSASMNTSGQSSVVNPLQLFLNKMKTVARHLTYSNAIFDGDSVFLREQDKKIRRLGCDFVASKDYYAPTSADLLVMAFRKWFETEGGYSEAYGGTRHPMNERELRREEMLDRYEQHTKHCKLCREGLKKLESLIAFLKTLSLMMLFIGSLILVRSTSTELIELKSVHKSVSLWSAISVGMVSTLLKNFLEKNIRPLYYFKDWVHAEND